MPNHPLLRPGANHPEVSRMKTLAKRALVKAKRGDLAKTINTKHDHYGSSAVKGVKHLQKHHKLVVDGIVGPKTWAMLEKHGVVPPEYQLVVVHRDSWGARKPKNVVKTDWNVNTVTRVHHTVTPPVSNEVAAEKAAMRQMQNYHMDSRGYADIGYNYVIFKSGRVYVGRGKEVVGAHTLGHNRDPGIAFYGDYTKTTMTYKQLQAYRALRKVLGLKGDEKPHSATYPTSCPGANVKKVLGI